jgi:hypothetical protein
MMALFQEGAVALVAAVLHSAFARNWFVCLVPFVMGVVRHVRRAQVPPTRP